MSPKNYGNALKTYVCTSQNGIEAKVIETLGRQDLQVLRLGLSILVETPKGAPVSIPLVEADENQIAAFA
jgi:hypothetical protein